MLGFALPARTQVAPRKRNDRHLPNCYSARRVESKKSESVHMRRRHLPRVHAKTHEMPIATRGNHITARRIPGAPYSDR